jgi:prevent-host-death family protein
VGADVREREGVAGLADLLPQVAAIWSTNLQNRSTMKEIAVYEAKTRLSELLVEVGQGGQVVITRRCQPVARLVGVAGARRGASSQRQRVSGLIASLREQRKGVVLEGAVRDLIAAGVGIAEAAV